MKKFFYSDKSGRGFTNNNLSLDDIKTWESEEDWNGEELHEWADDADEGDVWENAATRITCIKG